MKKLLLSLPVGLGLFYGAPGADAREGATFVCAAPAGHVCQFGVRTRNRETHFALPSGRRKNTRAVSFRVDKYCMCDPGPVTPNCVAPVLITGVQARGWMSLLDRILERACKGPILDLRHASERRASDGYLTEQRLLGQVTCVQSEERSLRRSLVVQN